MRRFYLDRQTDISGTSGTGAVVEGIQFSDGSCVVHWMTWLSSHGFYKSIEDVVAIHGHNGATNLHWVDATSSQSSDAIIETEETSPGYFETSEKSDPRRPWYCVSQPCGGHESFVEHDQWSRNWNKPETVVMATADATAQDRQAWTSSASAFGLAQYTPKKYVGVIPHDCLGGAGCAFPGQEHTKR